MTDSERPNADARAGRRPQRLKDVAAVIKARKESCDQQWDRLLSLDAPVPGTPFHVFVKLDDDQDDWVDVEVGFSARWAGGTTASFSVPFQALFKAAELARNLREALDKEAP